MVARSVSLALCLVSSLQVWAGEEFVYPCNGFLTSTYYSWRSYGNHAAIDIAAETWTPIGAARGGTVSSAGWHNGYGYNTIIDHGNGYSTFYAHQVSLAVWAGQQVKAGQLIGYVGSTGISTGPHLHFDIRRWGVPEYIPGYGGDWVTKGKPIPNSYPGLSPIQNVITPVSPQVVQLTSSQINVRSGPSASSSILGLVGAGQRYVVIATSGAWRQVWYDGAKGWIYSGYLSSLSNAPAVKIKSAIVNVRTGPGTGYPVVGQVKSPQYYSRIGATPDWIKIWYKGQIRWIARTQTWTLWF